MTLPKQQTAQGASDDDVLPKFATFQGAAFEHNPSSFQIKCTGSTTPLDIPYLHINSVYHIKSSRMNLKKIFCLESPYQLFLRMTEFMGMQKQGMGSYFLLIARPSLIMALRMIQYINKKGRARAI